MLDSARPVAERAADFTAATAGVTVSGATWFGYNVPELIQHATLVLILLQVGWWVYKLTTHFTKGVEYAGEYRAPRQAARGSHRDPD